MNKEMIDRLRTAGQYQKKAIRALFPETMNGHLEIIEKELKSMFMEAAIELMKECKTDNKTEEDNSRESTSRTRKVTIM